MANITVGLIPSPDMPHKIINKIYDELPRALQEQTNYEDWRFDKHVASVVGTAEHMDKAMDIAANMKKQKNGIMPFVLLIYQTFLIVKLLSVI